MTRDTEPALYALGARAGLPAAEEKVVNARQHFGVPFFCYLAEVARSEMELDASRLTRREVYTQESFERGEVLPYFKPLYSKLA